MRVNTAAAAAAQGWRLRRASGGCGSCGGGGRPARARRGHAAAPLSLLACRKPAAGEVRRGRALGQAGRFRGRTRATRAAAAAPLAGSAEAEAAAVGRPAERRARGGGAGQAWRPAPAPTAPARTWSGVGTEPGPGKRGRTGGSLGLRVAGPRCPASCRRRAPTTGSHAGRPSRTQQRGLATLNIGLQGRLAEGPWRKRHRRAPLHAHTRFRLPAGGKGRRVCGELCRPLLSHLGLEAEWAGRRVACTASACRAGSLGYGLAPVPCPWCAASCWRCARAMGRGLACARRRFTACQATRRSRHTPAALPPTTTGRDLLQPAHHGRRLLLVRLAGVARGRRQAGGRH